jgi:class 3 adenylate cyclase
VTLLVTDIVGSTRAWALCPAHMTDDLAAHDKAIREIVTASGGVVFKHTGDGAMAQFADPFTAVRAAAEIQYLVVAATWPAPEPLQVRVAVNTGTVVERDGDLFGTPVNRVARLLDLCPPGGVVIGSTTAGLLRDGSLDPLALRPVGRVQLKGLPDPEMVHAIVGPGLADVAPIVEQGESPLVVGSLPVPEDPLIGRGDELKAIWAAVLAHRVVSIIGVGGMGKTRLALEAATGLAPEFADGAWWCDLSAATSAEAVAPVIMDALATRQAPGRSPVESICDCLAGRRALVVLDNCEHVVDAVRDIVRAIRVSCPTVQMLATGREALGAGGEHVIPLSSLPLDDSLALFVGASGSHRCRTRLPGAGRGPSGVRPRRRNPAGRRVGGSPVPVDERGRDRRPLGRSLPPFAQRPADRRTAPDPAGRRRVVL